MVIPMPRLTNLTLTLLHHGTGPACVQDANLNLKANGAFVHDRYFFSHRFPIPMCGNVDIVYDGGYILIDRR